MGSVQDRYRTFWPRLRASIVDTLVLAAMLVAISSALNRLETPAGHVTGYLVISSAYLIYSILFHAYDGQTIGKRVNRIRVISVNNKPLTIRQAVLRDSPAFFPLLYQISVDIPYIVRGESPAPNNLNEVEQVFYLIATAMFLFWSAAEVVSMLTNPKRRAIHDFVAGSVVIRLGHANDPPRAPQAHARFAIVGIGSMLITFSLVYLVVAAFFPAFSSLPEPPSEETLKEAVALSCSSPETDDAVPVIRANPQYPPEAARGGQEGWVELEFLVTPDGAVAEPEVTNSTPPGVFDGAALAAVSMWRYCPQTGATRKNVRLVFELAESEDQPLVCDRLEASPLQDLCRTFFIDASG